MRVVVIGAGLAGLTAACHLVGRGHEVTVLERETRPGGRARSITRDGFTFDLGPVVMTMPELVESALTAAGSSLADLPMRRLDPDARIVLTSGFTAEHSVQDLLDAGLRGFLHKPFRRSDLIAALDSATARGRQAGGPDTAAGA